MGEYDYEALSMWQDILDEVVNGRLDGHVCPFCEKQTIDVTSDEARVFIKCNHCGKWVEGTNPF